MMAHPDILTIQKCVAEYCSIDIPAMLKRGRKLENCRPRMLAMYLCRKLTRISSAAIAHGFNRKDHTTVLHAEALITELLKAHPQLQEAVTEITRQVRDSAPPGIQTMKEMLSMPVRLKKAEGADGG